MLPTTIFLPQTQSSHNINPSARHPSTPSIALLFTTSISLQQFQVIRQRVRAFLLHPLFARRRRLRRLSFRPKALWPSQVIRQQGFCLLLSPRASSPPRRRHCKGSDRRDRTAAKVQTARALQRKAFRQGPQSLSTSKLFSQSCVVFRVCL